MTPTTQISNLRPSGHHQLGVAIGPRAKPAAGALQPGTPRKRRYMHGNCGREIPFSAPVAMHVSNSLHLR